MNKEEFIEFASYYNLIEHIDYEYFIIPKEVFKIITNSIFGSEVNKYYYKEKDNIFNHISESINKINVHPYKNFLFVMKQMKIDY